MKYILQSTLNHHTGQRCMGNLFIHLLIQQHITVSQYVIVIFIVHFIWLLDKYINVIHCHLIYDILLPGGEIISTRYWPTLPLASPPAHLTRLTPPPPPPFTISMFTTSNLTSHHWCRPTERNSWIPTGYRITFLCGSMIPT